MKEIMDTSLVEGYIFLFEVLDMVGKECQHVLLAVIGLLAQRLVGQCAYAAVALEYCIFYSSNGVWILFFNGKCYMENLALFLATYSFI